MDGFFVQGVVKGYRETPWKNGNGLNRTLGIVVRGYQDRWGDNQEVVQGVDIPGELASKVSALAEKYKGKRVRIRVAVTARDGARGAWLSVFMPKDSEIQLVPEAISGQKKSA